MFNLIYLKNAKTCRYTNNNKKINENLLISNRAQ